MNFYSNFSYFSYTLRFLDFSEIKKLGTPCNLKKKKKKKPDDIFFQPSYRSGFSETSNLLLNIKLFYSENDCGWIEPLCIWKFQPLGAALNSLRVSTSALRLARCLLIEMKVFDNGFSLLKILATATTELHTEMLSVVDWMDHGISQSFESFCESGFSNPGYSTPCSRRTFLGE